MIDDRPSDMTGDDFKASARDQLCANLMQRVESGASNQYSMYPNGVSLSINHLDGLEGESKWGCKISDAQSCKNALDDMANGDSGRRGDGGTSGGRTEETAASRGPVPDRRGPSA